MPVLLSFHNDPQVKARYLQRVRQQAQANEIVKGRYWDGGKGCAVGCTIHGADHGEYEAALGLPRWLAWLEDTLFEHLPPGRARSFPAEMLDAIPVGKDLDHVKEQFLLFLLEENVQRVRELNLGSPVKSRVLAALSQCRRCYDAIQDGKIDRAKLARSAETAARSARAQAVLAELVAGSPRYALSARSAQAAAAAATEAALSAQGYKEEAQSRSVGWSALSARTAAAIAEDVDEALAEASTAEDEAYVRYADKLIELLKAA